jgi:hypothetical protein
MKIKFKGGTKDGQEAEVLDAAGRRLVDMGVADEVKSAAKKAPAKKATTKGKASKSKA